MMVAKYISDDSVRCIFSHPLFVIVFQKFTLANNNNVHFCHNYVNKCSRVYFSKHSGLVGIILLTELFFAELLKIMKFFNSIHDLLYNIYEINFKIAVIM